MALPNSDKNVKVSDTTGDEQNYESWLIKILALRPKIYSEEFNRNETNEASQYRYI
jgi:hypothetical protein